MTKWEASVEIEIQAPKSSNCLFRTPLTLTMAGPTEDCLGALHPASYPALEVYVVLKRVLRYFSDSELRLFRLVSRYWNFTAASELVSRQFTPPLVKLNGSSRLKVEDYLNFENQRRKIWADSYGADCSIIEFRNLHLNFPLESEMLGKLLQQSWLSSVSSLTLSNIKTSDCNDFLIIWILAAFPNLLKFNCFVTSEGSLVSGLNKLEVTEASKTSENSLEKNLKSLASDVNVDQGKLAKLPNMKKALICIEDACIFPWSVFGASSNLQNLELWFGNAASLIKAVKGLAPASSPRTVQNLLVTLIRTPVFEAQVAEEDLHTESFAYANATLCNHFLPQSSLIIDSLIPAAYIFVFLKFLDPTSVTKLNLNFTAPYDNEPDYQEMRTTLTTFLVPEISLKFANVKDLELKFLQYETETPFAIPATETLKVHPNNLKNVDKLVIRTWPLHDVSEVAPWFKFPDYGLKILENTGFRLITHLVFEVGQDWDIAFVIQTAALDSIRIKKLVFQGSSDVNVCPTYTCACTLFPEICPRLPDETYRDRILFGSTYEGLPGINSLEILRLNRVAVGYQAKVEEQIHKAASLKSIYLDASFSDNFTERQVEAHGSLVWKWPSQIGLVSVVADSTQAF